MMNPIEKPVAGGIPINYFLSPELFPDSETESQLQVLARTEGLCHYVAVLPDIHRKSRNLSPTGAVVVSRDVLVPRAVDTGICCGMRMLRTPLPIREFTPERLDQMFAAIQETVPVYFHDEQTLADEELYSIFTEGGAWSQRRFGLTDEEMQCIEDRGTMPTDAKTAEEIIATMPKKSIKKGRKALGTLGDGNHFLELQEIVEIIDAGTAQLWGLEAGQAFFMLHTGSRVVGSKMMKGYLAEFEQRRLVGENPDAIWALPAASEDGMRYARAVAAASNFGFANRIAITEKVREAMRRVFADSGLQIPLLYDCAHVSIKKESWHGEMLWVHRHGASRALPGPHFTGHPLYRQTGQPLPIPGSMGHSSYIGAAGRRAEDAFFSVNHGAGRVMDKPEASSVYSEQQVEEELRTRNIRLYRYNSDNIAEQAPGSFKDINRVIEAMTALDLARPVARLRPVAVLKG